jgi:hypothetical protein
MNKKHIAIGAFTALLSSTVTAIGKMLAFIITWPILSLTYHYRSTGWSWFIHRTKQVR